ncbi:MAG: site-specific integrase, partial [Propionicimonas sp.]|nr:site-specific integrase [Propionicimonas sp.]
MSPTRLERLVRGYLDHLSVERGASVHTVAGYRRDLARYLDFLAARGITEPQQVGEQDVTDFAAALRSADGERQPLSPASVARAVVAVRGLP